MNTIDVFDELCESFPQEILPWLDRDGLPRHATFCQKWWHHGYIILPGFIPDDLIDNYVERYQQVFPPLSGGWDYATPYREEPILRDLVCYEPLQDMMDILIGEPMGVHLNLTGWVSTKRDWHQDGYLNPDSVADWYCATWVALDDIDPDSGPFEFVPGSHRWPTIRNEKMVAALQPEERGPDWPTYSERILTPFFTRKIEEEGLPVERFLAKKGDVLIWHARLLHRGSVPVNPNIERRACISHYSGISHREAMKSAVRNQSNDARCRGYLFPIDGIRR